MKISHKLLAGFTAIEMMMSIGTLAIAAGVAVPIYRRYLLRNDLEIARQNIAQGLERAKFLSQVGMNDSSWGFSTDAVPGRGVLFMGDSFATRNSDFDELYTLPTNITVDGLAEVSVEKITGVPKSTGEITLVSIQGDTRSVTVQLGEDGNVSIPDDWLEICYDPYGPDQETIQVPDSLWEVYEDRGSIIGSCSNVQVCGNGSVETGEECDDGNTVSNDGCSATCYTEICGDSITQTDEDCDDGGESASCNSDCTSSVCGDSVLNITDSETCDAGGESALCDSDCTAAACGDGNVNITAGETCDAGGESAICDSDCTVAVCGDGTLNVSAGEQCDDGNVSNGDGCDSSCNNEPVCGNSVVEGSEQCDDGNATNGDGCDAACNNEVCGNSMTQSGEECDDGGESASCDSDCTNQSCGDGTVNSTAGEDCDDNGESASCDTDCTAASCGDGTVNSTAGEACDDGNSSSGDGCSSSCQIETGESGGGGGSGPAVDDNDDDQGVNVSPTPYDCEISILGSDLDPDGYDMMITFASKNSEGGWEEPFGDWNKAVEGNINGTVDSEDCTGSEYTDEWRLKVASWKKKKNWYDGTEDNHWQKFVYMSNSGKSDNAKLLFNGDPIPSNTPFNSLTTIKSYVQPYVNFPGGVMTMDSNQALYLFELGTNSPSSSSDFQDLAILLTFEEDD